MSDAQNAGSGDVDTGPVPESMSHLAPVWDSMPTAARLAVRQQAEAIEQRLGDTRAQYEQQLQAIQSQATAQPDKQGDPQSLADLPLERLDKLGAQVHDRIMDALTANMDEEQRADFKALNGSALWGLVTARVDATVKQALSGVQNDVHRTLAENSAWGQTDTILPGAMTDGSPAQKALRDKMNAVGRDVERIRGRDAAEAYLGDPINVSNLARLVKAEMDAAGQATRTGPKLDDEGGSVPDYVKRAQALQRDGRPRDAFEQALSGFVSRGPR